MVFIMTENREQKRKNNHKDKFLCFPVTLANALPGMILGYV